MKSILLLALLPFTLFAQQKNPVATGCDILIRNGKIIDGSGNSWYYGDIAVKDGKIAAVGRQLNYTGEKTIDATGLIVAPGFIDVHTHLEGDETKDPNATNFIMDGVTTCITGNCGSSNTDIGKYLHFIDSLKLSINVATLVGHNDVRKQVMGRANRDASSNEMEQMKNIVDKAMRDGAVGLSTGLIYIPGTYTKTPEIVELAKVAAKYNGVYTTHMRDEGDSVTYAINEALAIGREAKIPVEISHFKLSGQQNWGRSKETVPMIEAARKEGIEVTIDQYPYTASSTSISTLIPDEILADGQDSINARLDNPATRKYVIHSMLERLKKES
jgi:N-acyl-D-amino-acid deacylase